MLDVDHGYPSRTKLSSPPASLSLDVGHVSDAVKRSSDNGATLDLSKKGLSDVGEPGVECLLSIGNEDGKEDVLRIALGSNRLTTLPMGFALLSRLRYLNLKNNNFSVFPDVLTILTSLDTLDISHNKIKRLPTQPGSLAQLRVFCFSRNKISRLPLYLAKFYNLSILKADRNPIEWPPKSIMDLPNGIEHPHVMKDWISSVQMWMEENTPRPEYTSFGGHNQDRIQHPVSSASSEFHFGVLSPRGHEMDPIITPHARSFSIGSAYSISSIAESSLEELESPPASPTAEKQLPHLRLPLRSDSFSASRADSPHSYLPSPEESADEGFTEVTRTLQQSQHARGASYAPSSQSPTERLTITKKSLPDLRAAKFKTPKAASGSNDHNHEVYGMPSPRSIRQDSESSDERTGPFRSKPSSTVPQVPTAIEIERNSYFKRMSALPDTISATLPPPLLCLVDSVRSILFAVSQVWETLQHYTVYASDERLSTVVRKVLDPASVDMMQLINSLDRFDAMSKKAVPSPTMCRAVVESCKDTVSVFYKAINVLNLQLKVLAARDDMRYLRQMLLVLYGATAEISSAWQKMIVHLEAVRPLLYVKRQPPSARTLVGRARKGSIDSDDSPISYSDLSSPPTSVPPSARRPLASESLSATPRTNGGSTGRIRTARRHAGSFSFKDVELGKKLPSYDEVPFHSNHPHLRTPSRAPRSTAPTSSNIPSSSSYPAQSSSSSSFVRKFEDWSHSRQNSQASLQNSSAGSSPSLSGKSFAETASRSRSHIDKEALDAMQVAVDAAPAVWDTIHNLLQDELDTNVEVRENLALAKVLTKRLRETISRMQLGDLPSDRKSLREDAHVFVKTVVSLSRLVKIHGVHDISAELRQNLVKLTNSTEEFVILLHVSSFSPIATQRSLSPPLNGIPNGIHSTLAAATGGLGVVGETGLGASLSRSRSAQPAATMKSLPFPTPRSALASQQTFNLPPLSRLREDSGFG